MTRRLRRDDFPEHWGPEEIEEFLAAAPPELLDRIANPTGTTNGEGADALSLLTCTATDGPPPAEGGTDETTSN